MVLEVVVELAEPDGVCLNLLEITVQLCKKLSITFFNLSYDGGGALCAPPKCFIFLPKISPPDQNPRPLCIFLILCILYAIHRGDYRTGCLNLSIADKQLGIFMISSTCRKHSTVSLVSSDAFQRSKQQYTG